jgi:hypothetical protein
MGCCVAAYAIRQRGNRKTMAKTLWLPERLATTKVRK